MSGDDEFPDISENRALRLTVRNVAALNLTYFGIEFAVALAIGSVALFADSVDFLEDGAVNLLILAGLGFSAARRAKLGMLLAAIILFPALATLWTAWQNFSNGTVPEPVPLTATGLGAFAVNFICARLLAPFRTAGGSLTRAAFLSARNDVIANVAIVIAGLLTAATASTWPDLIVGLGIAAINAGAAHEVYEAARAEHLAARS
ncbi:cation efflux protein [Hyphomicrobium denitrificans 1NES1]|uniref:Cation efflux protein n=1 Tax=Hyphomicrobium denitrificans 1NES1 TaxID=670307 RepID=N0B645_9HYPH|nr:cation transporter [Hyphomicrobium denitrificans]AGK57732.1 cation efflux protein [Hyphomicrobium denitrificans 1NES1]